MKVTQLNSIFLFFMLLTILPAYGSNCTKVYGENCGATLYKKMNAFGPWFLCGLEAHATSLGCRDCSYTPDTIPTNMTELPTPGTLTCSGGCKTNKKSTSFKIPKHGDKTYFTVNKEGKLIGTSENYRATTAIKSNISGLQYAAEHICVEVGKYKAGDCP